MMQGTLNLERLCTVLEQIFAERDDGLITKVSIIDEETEEEIASSEKTA